MYFSLPHGKGFVQDRFTTLPPTKDRAVCSQVYIKYDYDQDVYGIDFNGAWYDRMLHYLCGVVLLTQYVTFYYFVVREMVKSAFLDVFAGPPYTGTYSPSVQVSIGYIYR